ncbi:MAG TPA: sodium:solute symporter [Gemmatimonadaceae bacterium]|nr:sodium:solute symporter [Gemmatimonadaceae bacterium]
MTAGFTVLDAVVLVAYLAGTTLLGVWLGRRQRDTRDYFVAGHTIPWWAVLFSVVATETSALTFISIPSLAYLGDLSFLQIAAGYLLGRIVIAFTLLPRYVRGDLVTAYALLEHRFGVATRRMASVTFMATRAFGDSVRLFATAIPLALILGAHVRASLVGPLAILILGGVTLIYTYHGGMRAVIWTDVVQTGVYLLGGLAAVWLIGHGVTGGWGAILHGAASAGKLHLFDLYAGFDRPYTLLAGLLGGAFLSMASHGADQLIVQRLLAANSLRDARRALIGSGVGVILQFALFLLIGTGLFAYYHGRSFSSPDAIFPTFIIEAMPPGVTGLVIAAILAAAMSTMSGSLNSLAAASTHDIYLPLSGRSGDDPRMLRVARRLTLAWAVVLVGGALLYRQQGTPVVVVALSIASFTYGGLLGGFSLALLWRRADQRDAIIGMAIGISVMVVVVFARQLAAMLAGTLPSGATHVLQVLGTLAWPWYVLLGTIITFVAGAIASFTHPMHRAASAAPRGEPSTGMARSQ